jgi:amino-acid N-acetyltransferase
VEFFRKVGFHVVERGALPLKAWKDCLRCPKFQECDEIAVLRVLRPGSWALGQLQSWTSPGEQFIQIPTPRKP